MYFNRRYVIPFDFESEIRSLVGVTFAGNHLRSATGHKASLYQVRSAIRDRMVNELNGENLEFLHTSQWNQ